MTKIKEIDGYQILHTDTDQPLYCIKRTPTFMPAPTKLGGIDVMTMAGPIHYCGSHCPFFMQNGTMVELLCLNPEPRIGTVQIMEPEPNLTLLK